MSAPPGPGVLPGPIGPIGPIGPTRHVNPAPTPALGHNGPEMPAGSLLTLFDDIASILDDVAAMTKVATKKTAGILGDDLALNAEQVVGVSADRELPVVWAVALGSLKNKAILIPAAVALSQFAPWAVTPLLMAGGFFLCFEGVEKLLHKFMPHDDGGEAEPVDEKTKISGAIRTDFILSAEIMAITLGTVVEKPFATQLLTLCAIGLLMTVGVYGLVAGIVKLDDAGVKMTRKPATAGLGRFVLKAAPILMKTLSIAVMVAIFLVGGGIVAHGTPFIHHFAEDKPTLLKMAIDGSTGIVAGTLVVGAVTLIKRIRRKLN